MAKTKKRAAARAKNAKRGKASVKPARKKTVKKPAKKAAKKTASRSTTKPAKSKARRSAKKVTKPTTEALQPQQAPAPERAVELERSVETTIIAVVEAPPPTLLGLEDVLAAATSAPAESERQEGSRPEEDLDVWSGVGEAPEKKVA